MRALKLTYSQNQTKNISVVLPSSPNKFEANRSMSSWVMFGHSNKQTEITTLYIFRYVTTSIVKVFSSSLEYISIDQVVIYQTEAVGGWTKL